MKLDELARQSSGAARVSVAHLEAPPIGSATPNRSWKPLVAGVAVTALVVGGLAVLVRERTGSDAPASSDSALPSVVPVPRLGLELDGWTVSFASSFADFDAGPQPQFTYYGGADGDDPFAGGDLLIGAFQGADPIPRPAIEDGAETIELRGTTATVSSGADQGLPVGATSITWYEEHPDGTATEIVLVSRSADVDALTDIATGLTIDPETGSVTPADALGLELLATASSTPFDGTRRSGEGYLVAYERGEAADLLTISSTRGALSRDAAVMRWWTSDVQPVDVDGRPGFLATFDESMADLGPSLTWSPADGIVATISQLGAGDPLDLVALAASAFEIDVATWASYESAAAATQAGIDDFDEIFGQIAGTFEDSRYTWVLGTQGTELCFNLQVGNEGSGSCQPRAGIVPPDGSARTIDNGFGPTIAHVVIVADPAVERVVESQGRYAIERFDADGASWFVAIGDATVQPSFDVIVEGTAVATLEAAVEAIATEARSVADVSQAAELGLTDGDVVVAGDGEGFSWWLARLDDRLCLVTDSKAPSATCVPAADVVVFPPVVAPIAELTFVAVHDLPECVVDVRVDGGEEAVSAGGGNEQDTYEVRALIGESSGWQLELDVGGAQRVVELPATEGDAQLPARLCEG